MSTALLRRQPAVLLALLLLGALLQVRPVSVRAANATVGSGTPTSCTEAAFNTAFAAVQAGGGTLQFNCGAAPHTIIFSTQKFVAAPTVIRGGGVITLSGANATSLFQVYASAALTLSDITLTRGYGSYGAVESFGNLTVERSRLVNNTATSDGGAILSHGRLTLTGTTVSENVSSKLGGGVHINAGTASIAGSQIRNNRTTLSDSSTDSGGGGGVAVESGATLAVSGSTFSGNRTAAVFAEGGGIRSAGTLTVTNTLFAANSTSRGGAVSVVDGSAHISGSRFEGNWAAYGGGLRQKGGTLTVTATSFVGNGYASNGTRVTTGGGALSWGEGAATATLNGVTISGNWASYGGGFDLNASSVSMTNVTISGNAAVGSGGFDQNGGSLALTNTTIVGNTAQFFGGGVGNRSGTLTLANTVLAGNVNSESGAAWNCNKTLASASFSLSSDFTCGFSTGRDGVDVRLGPLNANGGTVHTHLPLRDSPAIDAGGGASCPVADARGVARPQGQACDVGAVEVTADDVRFTIYLPALRR